MQNKNGDWKNKYFRLRRCGLRVGMRGRCDAADPEDVPGVTVERRVDLALSYRFGSRSISSFHEYHNYRSASSPPLLRHRAQVQAPPLSSAVMPRERLRE